MVNTPEHISQLIYNCNALSLIKSAGFEPYEKDYNATVTLENMIMLITYCQNLQLTLAKANDDCISVFGEKGYPEYVQGNEPHELTDLVTADQLNGMLDIVAKRFEKTKFELFHF